MKIQLLVILIFSICLLTCNKGKNYNKTNKNNNISDLKKISPESSETFKLLNEIKIRTENYLKKYGIKKILLSNNGNWYYGLIGAFYIFKKNNILIQKYKGTIKRIKWKVIKNKLYIKYLEKYIQMKIFATKEFSYILGSINKNKYLRKIKYVLRLKTKEKIYSNSDGMYIFHACLKHYK